MADSARSRKSHTKTKTGCDTCKRRRVKCDETRPFCLKCANTGRTCTGYHPPRVWLFNPDEKLKSRPDQYERMTDVLEFNGGQNNSYHDGSTSASFYLDWSAAYCMPLQAAFLKRFIANTGNTGTNDFTAWPSIACKLAGVPRHEFLTTALMSLSLCILSHEDDEPRLWAGAVTIYQQSLPQLRKAISRLSQSRSDGLRKAVVAACCVCGHAEYILSSYQNATRHWEGLETILYHGGPEVLEDDGLRRIYYDHRSIWTNICVLERRTPIYQNGDWLSITESLQDSQSKTIFHRLWSILEVVPVILAKVDCVKKTNECHELSAILEQIDQISSQLCLWRGDSCLPPAQLVPLIGAPMEQRNIWLNEIKDKGLEVAASLNFYSAYSILLEQLKDEMGGIDQRKVGNMTHAPKGDRRAILYHVSAITETLPYQLDSCHGLEGVQHMPMAVELCWQGFETLGLITPERVAYFDHIGARMATTGYRPLNEPWLEPSPGSSLSNRGPWF